MNMPLWFSNLVFWSAQVALLVLAVSDEVDDALLADMHAVRQARLIVACGDLPFEYLGELMNLLDVPLVFVPGNHDPDISGYRISRAGLPLRAGLPPPRKALKSRWTTTSLRCCSRRTSAAGSTRARTPPSSRLPPIRPISSPPRCLSAMR